VDLGISGRVALVTGGSKGIGRAIAAGLASEGCRVAIAARGAEALRETAQALDAKGAETLSVTADLSEPAAPSRVVEAVVARFGRLEILVNNAGAIRGGDFLSTPAEHWADDWRLKILGYVRMSQAAIPVMRSGRWGRIVNVIGAAARNPATTYMAGGIANAGLINFTRALADLAAPDGILVNAVSPGATATERWDRLIAQQARAQGQPVEALRAEVARKQPLGRIGRPEDVADLVVFLASERAGFLTGASITVDGGASRGVYL
jgi:3-oxoacyl-[acyl-carrier protein] reductase